MVSVIVNACGMLYISLHILLLVAHLSVFQDRHAVDYMTFVTLCSCVHSAAATLTHSIIYYEVGYHCLSLGHGLFACRLGTINSEHSSLILSLTWLEACLDSSR